MKGLNAKSKKEVIFLDDARIVEMYWNRDEDAIPVTADKYGRYCKSVAVNILGSTEDADECVNDTYLAAWNSMPPHRPNFLSTFLGKLTRNLSFNRHKRNTAEKRGGGEISAVLDELSDIVSGKDNVEEAIEHRELMRDIDSFLESLPKKKRDIFIRRYWYTDSVNDISARYGLKPSAVSMMLKRLCLKMREHLTERGYKL